MAENIKVGWLTDKNGDKFAPKTLISQVQTNDGTLLADEIANIVKKLDDFSLKIYNGTDGNPKPAKIATLNYSNCDSNHGLYVKISLLSGHGNGMSYLFLEDAFINILYDGTVKINNFKYYDTPVGNQYDGRTVYYGDIFWTNDNTKKEVDVYCLMGQYSDVYMTAWKRYSSSTSGTVTQYTSFSTYVSGTKEWANNSKFVRANELTATDVGALPITGGKLTGPMTGQIKIECKNPYIELRDPGYTTSWYLQAHEDDMYVGTTYTQALQVKKSGDITAAGSITVEKKVTLDYDPNNECLNFVFI